jgi:hypothetical protein
MKEKKRKNKTKNDAGGAEHGRRAAHWSLRRGCVANNLDLSMVMVAWQ